MISLGNLGRDIQAARRMVDNRPTTEGEASGVRTWPTSGGMVAGGEANRVGGSPREEAGPGNPFLLMVQDYQKREASTSNQAKVSKTPESKPLDPPPSRPIMRQSSIPTLNVPSDFESGHTVKLQAVLAQQVWADEFNHQAKWIYETQKYNFELNKHRTDLNLTPPTPPVLQTTDPLEIAKEMDRINPQENGNLSYEQVLSKAGGTGYKAETNGIGLLAEYEKQMESLYATKRTV
jgi:hypothetical protein